jgi:nucleoside-diphosphate-sugar epimerase
MDFWTNRRVIVTGGSGFLGGHLVAALENAGAVVFVPRSAQFDLRTRNGVARMFTIAGRPDYLFHLAATVGGIGANMRTPADFLYENTIMNTLVMEQARIVNVGKIITLGSVCSYPKWCPTPFVEDNLWAGYPEETNAPYGESKRALLVHLQALRRQYGVNGVYLIPTNLYGPGDNSNPTTSHVIPALILRMLDAQRRGVPMTVWGTGNASRDFLYVSDCARALMMAAEWYNGSDPVNLGSGTETTISGLVQLLADIIGYDGEITWDATRPDGQPRRVLNSNRAWQEFRWKATTDLRDGLTKTVDWMRDNCFV